MNDIVNKKLKERLDDWTIRTIGIVDRTTFLVVADWNPKDNEKKKFNETDETFWTAMYSIDIANNKMPGLVLDGGLGKTYCDGGIINGQKEAFFGSFNGITYYLNYASNSFDHEELLMSTIKAGVNDIKLIGKHFYNADSGNVIFRRNSIKKWTMISKDIHEIFQKYRQNGRIQAIDGFSEEDIYFAGEDGLLGHYNGNKSYLIDIPANFPFTKIVCADNGKVYVGGRQGQVLVGKDNSWNVVISNKNALSCGVDMMHSMVYFQGTLYAGMRHDLMKLHKGKWVSANIEGIHNAEFLCAKDGIMLIGTNYSLFTYDGKEINLIYSNGEYLDAMFLGNKLLEVGTELLESGNSFLNALEEGKKAK